MKKFLKGLFSLTAIMVMVMAMGIVVYADAPEGDPMYSEGVPISSDAPVLKNWTDTTITVQTTYNREYLVWALDGTMSTWNVPTAQDYANGTFTFKNLKPGMGYRVYARERGDASVGRKAWDQPVNDMESSYVILPVRFVGVVKTPDYPNDIESYLPAYVYIYDMNTGEEVAPLQTIWNGYFDAYLGCAQGTYKLVAYSSKNSNMRIETTITVPVNSMAEYLLTDSSTVPTEAPTEPPTEAPTEAPTPAPTQAPTEAPTPAPTVAPTEAPTPAPTVAPTEAPTPAPTVAPTQAPTEAPTQKPTVAPTAAPTEAPTQKATEEVTTEAVTEEPTTEEQPTEAVTEEPATQAPSTEAPEPVTDAAVSPTQTSGGSIVWIVLGVIIGVAAAAGVVFAVKKFGNK